MFISFNQKIIDAKDAFLSIDHRSFLNGFAVFETVRTYHQKPFRLNDHLDRLFRSAELIGLVTPWLVDQVNSSIQDLLFASEFKTEKRFRIILADRDLIIMMMDLEEKSQSFYEDGVSLSIYSGVRSVPKAKVLGDVICFLANQHAQAEKAYDSVLVNPYVQKVTECSYANLFCVKDGKLFTTDKDILDGITRQTVLELADDCEFKAIGLEELLNTDEVFITQTSSGILPVVEIEGKKIGVLQVGVVTKDLMKKFDGLVWGE